MSPAIQTGLETHLTKASESFWMPVILPTSMWRLSQMFATILNCAAVYATKEFRAEELQ